MATAIIEERVGSSQKNCEHFFENVYFFEPNYSTIHKRGMRIFLGSKCRECSLFIARAKGNRFQICHGCGAKMVKTKKIIDGRIIYECESCNHQEASK
jgi:hypothetical protein